MDHGDVGRMKKNKNTEMLKQFRKSLVAKGWTYGQLASKANLDFSPSTICRKLHGLQPMTIIEMHQIEAALQGAT